MPYTRDPDGTQASELSRITDFEDKKVLEIGCGDGYLTRTYAQQAARVVALDPSAEDVELAIQSTATKLLDKVRFIVADILEFSSDDRGSRFDIALFAWSL